MIKKIADLLFKWFCREDYYLSIRGDLEENYLKDLKKYSKRKSDWLYLKEVLLLCRTPIVHFKIGSMNTSSQLAMIQSYVKIALRNIKQQKAYTAVNILGLSTGIISLFFILIFIESEMSFDQHHHDLGRLFRVSTKAMVNGDSVEMSTCPPGLKGRILAHMPEVESSVRLMGFLGVDRNILQYEDQFMTETKGYLADPGFFDLFNYPLLYGNKDHLLDEPQVIVLSKTLSDKLFPETNPTGRTLSIINNYGTHDYKITGVFDDHGVQSHISPAFICSLNSGAIGNYAYNNDRLVGNNFLFTYLKVRPNTDPIAAASKIQGLIAEHVDEAKNAHGFVPVADIYLYSGAKNESGVGGDIRYVYILMTIAALILFIACINFANMATAQAARRVREIGIRKTFGAQRRMIIVQFLGESVTLTFLAMIASLAMIFLLKDPFHALTGKAVEWEMILHKTPLLILIGILTSLLAGSYPAFYLSSLGLKNSLGNQKGKYSGSMIVRKTLVTFQFMVGILLIVGALVTIRQLDYIQSKPLGLNVVNQLVVPLQSESSVQGLEKIKTAFSNDPSVTHVAGTTYSPAQFVLSDNLYSLSREGVDEGVIIRQNDVDFGLIETLGIELIAGRTFSRDRAEEDKSVVLNEAAVKALGATTEQILGEYIFSEEEEPVAYRVIGIVKDFHSRSLHREIEPYLFAMRAGNAVSSVIVTVDGNNYQETINSLEASWNKLFPTLPFEFYFLDEQLKARYVADIKFGQVIVLFAVVALILCLIGIFALTTFTVQQSLKELSIRKVLGASVSRIFGSLISRFLLLVLIASTIAVPIGIMIMEEWLGLFAYRITTDIYMILTPVILILISTFLVISYKILFVARINPATILRSE